MIGKPSTKTQVQLTLTPIMFIDLDDKINDIELSLRGIILEGSIHKHSIWSNDEPFASNIARERE